MTQQTLDFLRLSMEHHHVSIAQLSFNMGKLAGSVCLHMHSKHITTVVKNSWFRDSIVSTINIFIIFVSLRLCKTI